MVIVYVFVVLFMVRYIFLRVNIVVFGIFMTLLATWFAFTYVMRPGTCLSVSSVEPEDTTSTRTKNKEEDGGGDIDILKKIARRNTKARQFLKHFHMMMRLMQKDRDIGDVLSYSTRATDELKTLELNADDASPESAVLSLIRRVSRNVEELVIKYIQRKNGNVDNYLLLPY